LVGFAKDRRLLYKRALLQHLPGGVGDLFAADVPFGGSVLRGQIISVMYLGSHRMSGCQSALYKEFTRSPIRGDNG
jgi:hypothetical protein